MLAKLNDKVARWQVALPGCKGSGLTLKTPPGRWYIYLYIALNLFLSLRGTWQVPIFLFLVPFPIKLGWTGHGPRRLVETRKLHCKNICCKIQNCERELLFCFHINFVFVGKYTYFVSWMFILIKCYLNFTSTMMW